MMIDLALLKNGEEYYFFTRYFNIAGNFDSATDTTVFIKKGYFFDKLNYPIAAHSTTCILVDEIICIAKT